jgi:hypothetical protein
MSKTEINHFLRILPDYYKYIKENETTFIAKIFGIFSVRIDSFEHIYTMIM